MTELSNKMQFELLSQIQLLLDDSAKAYKEYMDNGKTFFYAKILWSHNEKLKMLILEKANMLEENLRDDAFLLVAHYKEWMQKWVEHQKKNQPKDNDEFAFPNEHVFPKQAARNLHAEYDRLKQLIHGE
jgi:hypothetical protein